MRCELCLVPVLVVIASCFGVGARTNQAGEQTEAARARHIMLRFQRSDSSEMVSLGNRSGGGYRRAEPSDKPSMVTEIGCWGEKVSDDDLVDIMLLSNLRTFSATRTEITDQGFRELAKLKDLMALRIVVSQITDDGLRSIGTMKQLSALTLQVRQITDAGISHLRGLEKLQALDLDGTSVTDASLPTFKAMPKLKSVNVIFTKFSYEAAVELKNAKPGLKIYPFFDADGSRFSVLKPGDGERARDGETLQAMPPPAPRPADG